jgi:N-acetylmuramoyl-L-alanine amidase
MTRPERNVRHLLSLLILLWLVFPAGIASLAGPVLCRAGQTEGAITVDPASAYQRARAHIKRLEHSDAGQQRENWLSAVREFRRLYWLAPKSSLAPKSLYMTAVTHARMYSRFHLRIDLDEAITYYQKVAGLFPKSNLADDALYTAAELIKSEKKDSMRAAELYKRIVSHYPKGDYYHPARKALLRLTKEKKISLQESENLIAAPPPATVSPVKYWSSDDYSRVVIQTSRPVSYTSKLLEKDGDRPRRLYLDLSSSHIAPQHRQPLPIEDGLLKRIRSGQFNNNTVRVVLDIQSISDYHIFNLKDPFRIVIDVHGIKKKQQQNIALDQKKGQAEPKKQPRLASAVPIDHRQETVPILRDQKKRRAESKKTAPAKRTPVHRRPSHKGQQAYSLAQQLGLGVRRILLDPGHGGKDPGAMAHGMKEKNIVLTVAKNLRDILREQYGYEVIMTRTKDVFLPLEERTALANTSKADLFVSIHVNAHPDTKVRGIETFYLNLATNEEAMRVAARENATSTHNISEMQNILTDLMNNSKIVESAHLAQYVQNNLVNGLKRNRYPVRSHGVKQAPFYVLIGARMPAILAEISFITNPGDARLLGRRQYLYDIASQIAAGLHGYANKQLAAGGGR